MKKSMMFVTVVFVAMMAFVGCDTGVGPTPLPTKVVLSDTFVNVKDGTTMPSGVYYWDDEPGVYYTSGDVELTDKESGANLYTLIDGELIYDGNDGTGQGWILAEGTTVYLNTKWLSTEGSFTSTEGTYTLEYLVGNAGYAVDVLLNGDSYMTVLNFIAYIVDYPGNVTWTR